MIHLTLNQISAYIDAELPEASVELVRLHLSSCLECAERFGHIEEQEEALSRLLTNDPGDRFFEGFAARVVGPMKPVPKPEPKPETRPERKPEPRSEPKFERTPEPRPEPKAEPKLERKPDPKPERERARNTDPPKPTPARRGRGRARLLVPVGALLLLVSAVAVIVIRPRLPGLPGAGAPAPSAPDASTAEPPAPPANVPTPASPGAAGESSGLLESAAAMSAEAERTGTAEDYDRAARGWEAALPGLASDPDELAAGRREIADARFAAWSRAATPERRAAAMSAVRAYLLCAPAGAERDRAWSWLAELKR